MRTLAARALLAASLCVAAAAAFAQAASEAAVKAAFLFRFAAYVEWPQASFPQSDTPFVI